MAIIDWPTSRPFQGAQLQLDLAVQRSGFTGFYSGQRQHVSHAADRRTAMLTLPPCKGAAAHERQAFLHALLSRGDWLRMGVPHSGGVPRGTLRGSPTVGTTVAAGARSITLAGAYPGGNAVRYPEDFRNTAEAGSARPWQQFNDTGNAVLVTQSSATTGPFGSADPSKLQCGITGAVQRQVSQALPSLAVDGATVNLSVYAKAGEVWALHLLVETRDALYPGVRFNVNAGTATPFAAGAATVAAHGIDAVGDGWYRCWMAVNVRSGSGTPAIILQLVNTTGGHFNAVAVGQGLYLWGAQAAAGEALPEYQSVATLSAGDWLGCGGNLLQVDYAGAVGAASGAMTVPLITPLQRPITAGAAVTWANPTGLWELDAEALQIDMQPGGIQGALVLPLREVFA